MKTLILPPSPDSFRKEIVDNVPAGWFSRKDLEKHWNLGTARTSALVSSAVDAGKAEVKQFKVRTGLRVMHVPHYRFN